MKKQNFWKPIWIIIIILLILIPLFLFLCKMNIIYLEGISPEPESIDIGVYDNIPEENAHSFLNYEIIEEIWQNQILMT